MTQVSSVNPIDQYQADALTTCAPTDDGMLERMAYAAGAIRITVAELRATRLLERIDDIKKFVFYGKMPARPLYDHAAPGYRPVFGSETQTRVDLIHAILGVLSEGDELLEPLLKCLSPIDNEEEYKAFLVNMAEEFGDIPWYLACGARGANTSLRTILEANIAKLKKRYPQKFTQQDATTRDLKAEDETLRRSLGM